VRQVLEAASVVGEEFAAVVVAGAQCPVEDAEARGEALVARHHFIGDARLMTWPDRAQQRSQEALALAHQVGHTPSLAIAEYFLTTLCQCRRDVAATHAHAEALTAIACEQGFPLRFEEGRILRGWALAMQGDADEGLVQIRQGLAAHQDIGPRLGRPYRPSMLSQAYGQAPERAAALLAPLLHRTELRHDFVREAIHLGDQVGGRTGRPEHEFGQTGLDVAGDPIAAFLGRADGPERLHVLAIGHAVAEAIRHGMRLL
jgi:hypothetical protein